jgi:ribose transport system substrate-binding protein
MAQDATPTSDSPFFVQEDFERQLAQRTITPEGPADQPWIQAIEPEYVDTTEYATDAPWKLCFSNASVNNPWRVTGFTTMQEEVKLHPEIGEFVVVDAEADDNKQISDISDLLGQGCSALIVSPNTTAALTPAVEEACGQIPVIVFDRGVNTDCPVTFIHPIGGYAFGADAAEFLVEEVPEGGNILALRILPGVDVLETRWAAADIIFQQNNMNVVGTEFSNGDRATVKSIVTDYIERFGQIDGVWMDAGQDAVAAIEAFEDLGLEVPPITGEDQQDFLQKWSDDDLTAVAPTYSNFQWRTPIIAATMILSGEQVPAEWVLPQPLITSENLADYLQPDMPPQHYALCGCENMEGFPEVWQNR